MIVKSTFNRNFDTAILKALKVENVDFNQLQFEIIPIFEEKGEESSKDTWMIHVKLNYSLKDSDIVDYKEAIRLMSGGNKHYPLWARVKKLDDQKLSIEFSTRYRHIKNCHNQETGFPPFENTQY